MESQPLIESCKGSTKPSSQQSISYKSILIWFFRKTLWQRKNVYILVTLLIPILYLLCYCLVGLNEPNYKYAKEVIESIVKEERQGLLESPMDGYPIIDYGSYLYFITNRLPRILRLLQDCRSRSIQIRDNDAFQRYSAPAL